MHCLPLSKVLLSVFILNVTSFTEGHGIPSSGAFPWGMLQTLLLPDCTTSSGLPNAAGQIDHIEAI